MYSHGYAVSKVVKPGKTTLNTACPCMDIARASWTPCARAWTWLDHIRYVMFVHGHGLSTLAYGQVELCTADSSKEALCEGGFLVDVAPLSGRWEVQPQCLVAAVSCDSSMGHSACELLWLHCNLSLHKCVSCIRMLQVGLNEVSVQLSETSIISRNAQTKWDNINRLIATIGQKGEMPSLFFCTKV